MPRCKCCYIHKAQYTIFYPFFGTITNKNNSEIIKIIKCENDDPPIMTPIMGQKLCVYCYYLFMDNVIIQ